MRVKNDKIYINIKEYNAYLSCICKSFNDVNFNLMHSRNRVIVSSNGFINWRHNSKEGFIVTDNAWGFEDNTLWGFKKIQRDGVYSGEVAVKPLGGKIRVNRASMTYKPDNSYKSYYFKKGRLYINDDVFDEGDFFCRISRVKSLKEQGVLCVTLYGKLDTFDASLGDVIMRKSIDPYHQTNQLRIETYFYGKLSQYIFKESAIINDRKVLIFKKGGV